MARFILPCILLNLSAGVVLGQNIAMLTNPTRFPLAIRTPYLNSWIGITPNVQGGLLDWPRHYSDDGYRLGWLALVRVDSTTYSLQGPPTDASTDFPLFAKTVASYLTPTRSIFTVEAGPMRLNLTYLSPVEPSDWVRQSFPFSYLSIEAWSLDGSPHHIQLYSDLSGQWLVPPGGDPDLKWNTTQTSTSIVHSVQWSDPNPFTENNNYSQDGTLYFATPKGASVTWQIGNWQNIRGGFNQTGSLQNFQDPVTSHKMSNPTWTIWAVSQDLGTILKSPSPFVVAIGVVRELSIRVTSVDGLPEQRTPYFYTQYSKIDDAIDAFLVDFNDASLRANALDQRIMSEAGAISSDYADLVALSLRPTFAAIDITVTKGSTGVNASDAKAYMKDLGSSGRITAIETLYASLPALLYLNASLARLLLDPLLEFQSSSRYSKVYAAPDLGTTYPDLKGVPMDEPSLAVENCGTMLVMVLAHAKKSGDGSLLQRHYQVLKKWTDFLIDNTFQSSYPQATYGSIAAGSNLILKGVVGIHAMSAINRILEPVGTSSNDTERYDTIARRYMQKWKNLTYVDGHTISTSGIQASWGLMYNAYAPALLNVSLIDAQVLSDQSSFYAQQALSAPKFGFPYDSAAPLKSSSGWTVFTAAAMPDTALRDTMISMVHKRAVWNSTDNTGPWPLLYHSETGTSQAGFASPALGAMFSFLAMNVPDKPVRLGSASTKSAGPGNSPGHSITGALVGGIIGGLALIAIILAGVVVFFIRRNRKRTSSLAATKPEPFNPQAPVDPSVQPRPVNTTVYNTPFSKQSMKRLSVSGIDASSSSLRDEVDEIRREMREMRALQVDSLPTYSATPEPLRPQR